MTRRRLRRTDLIVGCSEHITATVVEAFPELVDRCRTIYNGVDVDRFGASQRRTGSRALRLLHVGRVSPEKGLHALVDAFNVLVREYRELELVIVGDEAVVPREMAVAISDDPLVRALARFYKGDYAAWVRGRLTDAAARRVTFVGRIEHGDADSYYRDADIFVFPSIFESFAIPPVEALAAGLPVVASRVGGMRETIIHGETGFLVEREDPVALAAALRLLIDDGGLRRAFGEAGRNRADLFSWRRIAADVETAVTGLAPAASARPQPMIDAVELR
jgi:glycosyltransferase involved in cell wall biosynthesis